MLIYHLGTNRHLKMTNANSNSLFYRFVGNPSARRAEVEKIARNLSFHLPESYLKFMLARNGGEGFIGKSYLVLWQIEELIVKNNAYRADEFVPGFFLFGSDGGGEAYAFDTRSETCGIVSIPSVVLGIEDAKRVASDFESFLSVLSAA
jgi:hypothetical protein